MAGLRGLRLPFPPEHIPPDCERSDGKSPQTLRNARDHYTPIE